MTYQPECAPALLARGRLLLAEKQPAEAIASLEHAALRNPLPEYRWTLADALRLVDRIEDAERTEHALIANGAQEDPRTLALFLATRQLKVDEAIATATRELQARSDVFTLDAVAWALAAGNRLDEASETMARALTTGTEDARLFLHAAVIAHRQDRRADADRWAAKAAKLSATLAKLLNLLVLEPDVPGIESGRTDIAGIFIPDLIEVDLSTGPVRLAGGGPSHPTNPDDPGFSR